MTKTKFNIAEIAAEQEITELKIKAVNKIKEYNQSIRKAKSTLKEAERNLKHHEDSRDSFISNFNKDPHSVLPITEKASLRNIYIPSDSLASDYFFYQKTNP